MAHEVKDTDTRFVINPINRTAKSENLKKTTIIQYDHNSERFTFECPRYIEGHDMSLCNKVEVHYLNIDTKTKLSNSGVYTVEDLRIDPNDTSKVLCSWVISQNGTQLLGILNYVVRYSCIDENSNEVLYAWNTAISTVNVSEGINASLSLENEYIDVIEQWKKALREDLKLYIDENINNKVAENIAVVNSRIDSLAKLTQGSTTGDAELQDIRIGADGTTYETAGTAVREQQKQILNMFNITTLNLFNGNYTTGVTLNGTTESGFTIGPEENFNSLAIIPVKPNTKYSILVADGGREDNGYYYFKACSVSVENVKTIDDILFQENTAYFTRTGSYDKIKVITTDENAKYLLVQASKTKQPFLQIVEGEQNDFTVSDYSESRYYEPSKNLGVYSKDEVSNLLKSEVNYIIRKEDNNTLYIFHPTKNGFVKYQYYRHINNAINLDTWQMGAIELIAADMVTVVKQISGTGHDQEGVLKIKDEPDYVGGIHGDEQFTNVWFLIDGKIISLSEIITDVYCKEFKVIVSSKAAMVSNLLVVLCGNKDAQPIVNSGSLY